MSFSQTVSNYIQVFLRLRQRNTVAEARNRRLHMYAAIRRGLRISDPKWDIDIRRAGRQTEICGHHPNNGVGIAAQGDGAANCVRASAQRILPKAMTHDSNARSTDEIVRSAEDASALRSGAERGKQVERD